MTDTEQKVIKEICKVAHIDDISDLSDGHHTFRQLYYQRMMLFATLVKQNRDKAWKSLCHEDGELCFGGGWFIVGIDTPEGSYTYHYEDNYFSLFDCVELERGKHWDGHTEEDVTRLLSLQNEPCDDAISREDVLMALTGEYTDSPIEILSKAIKRINALPSVTPTEKVEPCDDCISRQTVINRIANTCFWLSADNWNELIKCINSISPVTPADKCPSRLIKILETWDNLFKSYEVLTKEITESGDIKNATKRIDDWCIEQLRGIISDHYADLIIKEDKT